ncbi:MAG TPA: tryptophan--tRNA ligase, partial [Candidatus Moranbacteria bacterium]|nr:tryptophan--tRNA ligase [Candidatus Moranbacteria bacterium]
MKEKKIVFSGVQPTGDFHIGNYLGALLNWVDLQEREDMETIFCVVDLHAVTVAQDRAVLRENIKKITRIYLAAGIDPDKSLIFVQSDVPAHSELCWLLNTIARMGEMEKMTQFKDKSRKEGADRAGVGLFDYPVLMAADILLYDTDLVPVGEDQVQHVELTRKLARRFNRRFGQTFVVPRVMVRKEAARIMGLDDPTRKMSKSAPSAYNRIALSDDAETVRRKIRKAVTDSGNEIVYSDDKPALKNLINIYHLLSGREIEQIVRDYAGKGYGDFKKDLAEVLVDFLTPLQERMSSFSDEDVRG